MATDLTGKKFARWLVTGKSPRKGNWECVCDCGTAKSVGSYNLTSGASRSCGCLMREVNKLTRRTHGASINHKVTPEYAAWMHLKSRCENQDNKAYQFYGERGITVCKEWDESFEAFLKDMGPKPSSAHSIDRIDVNGNYEPSNCRWATRKEQARNKTSNRMVVYNGREMTMAEAAELAGIRYWTLASRLSKGWTVERALSQPLDQTRVKAQFRDVKLVEISRSTGIPVKTIQCRLRRGWSEERAFNEPVQVQGRHAQRNRGSSGGIV